MSASRHRRNRAALRKQTPAPRQLPLAGLLPPQTARCGPGPAVCRILTEDPAMQADVLQTLGGAAVCGSGSPDFTAIIERGLPVQACRILCATLGLTSVEKTRLLRKIRGAGSGQPSARLDPAASLLLLRIARALVLACRVLESREYAVAWLHEPNDAWGGRKPLELLVTQVGYGKVSNALYQMEYGIYA